MKISIAVLAGFVLGLIFQVSAVYGFHESLLAQIPLIISSFALSLFLRVFLFFGFLPDVNLIPLLFSFSIPLFYAMIGGLIAFGLRRLT